MRRHRLIFAVLVVAAPADAATQDTQLWSVVSLGGTLSGKLVGTAEAQVRRTDDLGRVGATLGRASFGWRASKRVTLSVGYTHVESSARGGPDIHEDNLFQQINWQVAKLRGVTIRSRTYLEERWLNRGQDLGVRLRQRVRLELPIRKKGALAILSSEGFAALNSTDWGAQAGFDQMRNFIGVNVPVAKGLTIETGYLNRYQRRRGGDRIDHIIPLILAYRF